MRDIDMGGGWCHNRLHLFINITPILCSTCVNVRIIIRLPNIIKVFMSLNTFE